jgi:hypothetical protein
MELDDLKKVWNEQVPATGPTEDRESIQRLISRSNRSIVRALRLELAIGGILLAFYFGAMLFLDRPFSSFHYKMIIPILALAIPVYYRLNRSSQALKSIDFGGDVRSTLGEFLRYYRQTLRIYRLGAYVAFGLLIVIFLTDEKFLSLSATVQYAVIGYILLVALVTGPFIRWMYGGNAEAIRKVLEESE